MQDHVLIESVAPISFDLSLTRVAWDIVVLPASTSERYDDVGLCLLSVDHWNGHQVSTISYLHAGHRRRILQIHMFHVLAFETGLHRARMIVSI